MSKKIKILFDPADRERLQPILDALRAKGVVVSELSGDPARDEIVLAALSEHFYANEAASKKLLSLIGAGAENVLPLQLDELPIPETLKSAIYSRNIIPAAGREPAQIAERITAAMPEKKNGLPKLLAIGAVVLLLLAGLLIWRGARGEEKVPASTEPELSVTIPAGLTMEDLEKIETVIIVGDHAEFYTSERIGNIIGHQPEWDEFANRNYDDRGAHYYSKEDGHEYQMTRYEDLRFLGLMPKLHALSLALVDADVLPDLSACTRLQTVFLGDCEIPDVEWLAGSNINSVDILNSTGSIRDFSPLTRCEKLSRAHIDIINNREADLSGFGPPRLSWLWINNGRELRGDLDLSGLKACTGLREVELENEIPIRDLSFLSGTDKLYRLRMDYLSKLEDISILRSMDELMDLNIHVCNRVRDYSPIAGCVGLEIINITVDNGDNRLRDASFLADLPKLKEISLNGIDLPDLEFLRGIAEHQKKINFGICGEVGNYEGLSAIQRYGRLNLDPDNGRIAPIIPFLEGATVDDLALRRITDLDLSALPKITSKLELDRCSVTDLSTLPENWAAPYIHLNKCSTLRSLEGVQTMKKFTVGPTLDIYNCPRLTDWSALEGMRLQELRITGGFSLPAFDSFKLGKLRLESVADVTDLEFLNDLDNSGKVSFELVGLDELKSLAPLRRFHGDYLAVPPQLAEQAQDLVDAGNFREYRVEFPEGGWEMDNIEFALLSLDELETMPKAMLRRVSKLCLVGDTVVDLTNGDIWEDWDNGRCTLLLHNWSDDSTTPIKYGPGTLYDFELFKDLTGLRELILYEQPLTTLDGIQNFPELEGLQVRHCEKLMDASAVFACQNLRWAGLDNCRISSIQGVQNLSALNSFNINNTQVSDLSPLAECDFSAAVKERGGLELFINNLPVEDFSPLAGLPLIRLDINDTDPERFVRYLDGMEDLRILQAYNCFCGRGEADDNALFADLVRSHPGLTELMVPWNEAITDLTPVLELEHLERLRLSRNMTEAIASLEGRDYDFVVDIEG